MLEVYLRADITKGCRPRNVYLTHARCLAALEAWLEVGTSVDGGFLVQRSTEAFDHVQNWSLRTRAKPLN